MFLKQKIFKNNLKIFRGVCWAPQNTRKVTKTPIKRGYYFLALALLGLIICFIWQNQPIRTKISKNYFMDKNGVPANPPIVQVPAGNMPYFCKQQKLYFFCSSGHINVFNLPNVTEINDIVILLIQIHSRPPEVINQG